MGNLQDSLNNRLCSQCPNLDINPFVLTISTIRKYNAINVGCIEREGIIIM